MKNLIMIYLLIKSATKQRFTHLDSLLAYAITLDDVLCPEWLKMIANMDQEGPLPEAFGLFMTEVDARVEEWMA